MRRRKATLLNCLIAILDHRIARWSPVAQTDRKNEKGRERGRWWGWHQPAVSFSLRDGVHSLEFSRRKPTSPFCRVMAVTLLVSVVGVCTLLLGG